MNQESRIKNRYTTSLTAPTKIFTFCSLLLILNSYFIIPSHAHVLEADEAIGAVIHIEPKDEPIANQPSTIYLEFKNTDGDFQLSDCTCTVTIKEKGKTIITQPLSGTGTSGTASVTFPKKDIYILEAKGTPVNGAHFEPFTLSYTIRVANEVENTKPNNITQNWVSGHIIHLIGAGVIALIFIFALIRQARMKK